MQKIPLISMMRSKSSTARTRTEGADLLYVIVLMVPLFLFFAPSAKAQERIEISRDCAKLSMVGDYPDYEPMPKYAVERREYDASHPPILLLRISVPESDMIGGSMARLGCKLISTFGEGTAVDALIFDDKRAARTLEPGFTEQHDYGVYLWHLKAHLQWDPTKRQGFIDYLVPVLGESLLRVRPVRIWLTKQEKE